MEHRKTPPAENKAMPGDTQPGNSQKRKDSPTQTAHRTEPKRTKTTHEGSPPLQDYKSRDSNHKREQLQSSPHKERRHKDRKHRHKGSKSHSRSPIKKGSKSRSPIAREAGEIEDGSLRGGYDRRPHNKHSRHRDSRREDRNGRGSRRGSTPLRRSRLPTPTKALRDETKPGKQDTSRPVRGDFRRHSATPPRAALPDFGFTAEIRKAALEVQRKREAEAKAAAARASQSNSDAEDAQLDVRLGGARRDHSPIVWGAPAAAAPEAAKKRKTPDSAEEAEQVAALRKRKKFMDGKARSPSDSEDESQRQAPLNSTELATLAAYDEDEVTLPAKSRWQLLEEEEERLEREREKEKPMPVEQEQPGTNTLNKRDKDDLEAQLSGQPEAEHNSDEDWDSFKKRGPIDMRSSSRSVEDSFERLNKISEGTYGVVHRARDKETNEICALKRIKMDKSVVEQEGGFPLTSIREINILLSLRHKNIVNVNEVVVGKNDLDQIYMVMEYMEHDLKALMESMKHPFTVAEVKNLMKQMLEGIAYLHESWVLHRDMKTSNILYNNRGEVKICDFGLARQFGSPLRPLTHNVVTMFYRAIELLLGQEEYSTAIDVWSLGCIMAELLTKKMLFMGRVNDKGEVGELSQIDAILKILGTPNEKSWPGYKNLPAYKVLKLPNYPKSRLREIGLPVATRFDPNSGLTENGFDLLEKLLTLNPKDRISAADALKHPWFREHPLPKDNVMMPTFAASRKRDGTVQRQDPIESPRHIFASKAQDFGVLFARR